MTFRTLMCVPFLAMLAYASRAGAADDWRYVAEHALERSLRGAYPQAFDWTIELIASKGQLKKLGARAATSAEVVHLGQRSNVRVEVREGERTVRFALWFAVNGKQQLITASRSLGVGAALDPHDGVSTVAEVPFGSCSVLSLPSVLEGMRVKHALRAGEPFCAESIELRPAVGKGERVIVRSNAGAVSLVARGVAQQDGALGQRLRIKNPSSGETYTASVSAVGEVTVP